MIGEGEVGKSCLLGALREDEWLESRPTTHGIEIKPVIVTHPDSGTEISLTGGVTTRLKPRGGKGWADLW